MVRGIRGATTVKEDVEEIVLDATEELLALMIEKNEIQPEDVAQVLITVTEDLIATFPAKALRRFEGFDYVPVMCAREIAVPGSLENCIRIMMTVNTDVAQDQITHIYLNDAVKLRPDLVLTDQSESV
ncbi:chorismate mutase [Alkalihalobacillus alcalophilus ATCC 27647 = CGMCC 1.3604]|uniref:chorismate mutase n=1 Tax=Alkalihalobacillus alcalophilus ATCC 27647 = CGMCC 1.3604 TaxID=1218173 RepID=A0A094WQR7_ALKAL|nr:chorismate mutase [Alkalihalobacillus alcalophilus]KGA99141.1 chorismate mutase [Alkalihalobacillus alcalophilus ATCC 27647 = CGMCC 1.3604]MED1560488.1 chorismate mutase [Alkalihalobacillus alcalophilus]THG92027.1 chorismate mutase [Alkalihalobacillus alcalophilus ATCC 27647 = CGMCC 1.3604]